MGFATAQPILRAGVLPGEAAMISGHLRERAGALTLNLRRCGNGSSWGALLHGQKGNQIRSRRRTDRRRGRSVGDRKARPAAKRYIQRGARRAREVLASQGERRARAYIELYSGAGRSRHHWTQIRSSRAAPWWPSTLGARAAIRFPRCTCLIWRRRTQLRWRSASRRLADRATSYVGEAGVVVDQVMNAINPYGLHLAFLDPFNLSQLPFSIIEKMLRVKRMDMIIHVSVQDFAAQPRQAFACRSIFRHFCAGMARCSGREPIKRCSARGVHRVLASPDRSAQLPEPTPRRASR